MSLYRAMTAHYTNPEAAARNLHAVAHSRQLETRQVAAMEAFEKAIERRDLMGLKELIRMAGMTDLDAATAIIQSQEPDTLIM